MAITINGSGSISGISAGGLPDGSVTADDLASTLDLSGKTVTLPSGTGGKVLQVVSATKTDTFSASVTSGNKVAVTGLSITHTLSSSSNKLLLMAYFGVAASSFQYMPIGIALADNGSLIGIGNADGSRTRVGAGGAVTGTGNGFVVSMPHIHLLYSPGDTSSHTYTANIINVDTSTQTLYVNRTLDTDDNAFFSRGASAITLMEIAG